ncbi:ankyrin repeat domain-containing protein [Candidatus Babeliales bacterium]|nr:ankyrin repeat domain-containing protein [Candidatus Babeliales bacterium]
MNKKLLLVTLLCATGYTLSAQQNMAALNAQLIEAAFNGNKEKVQDLLENGANVNTQNQQGYTALMAATDNGHDSCVRLLLTAPEIQVNAQSQQGETALMFAAVNGHDSCVRLLLTAPGIQVNAQDQYRYTALMFAAQNGHTSCVRLLLTAPEIQVNTQNQQGHTALMLAADSGHDSCVQLLIAARAFTETRDNTNRTAYDYAVQNGHQAIADILHNEGLDEEQI